MSEEIFIDQVTYNNSQQLFFYLYAYFAVIFLTDHLRMENYGCL